mmetsp:Transcript_6607/g.12885  ORF Transcript_6607/g.12885 Transcript_6607/m.12885 type:complete len:215 (-) Transcript_6607:592-1236(-)
MESRSLPPPTPLPILRRAAASSRVSSPSETSEFMGEISSSLSNTFGVDLFIASRTASLDLKAFSMSLSFALPLPAPVDFFEKRALRASPSSSGILPFRDADTAPFLATVALLSFLRPGLLSSSETSSISLNLLFPLSLPDLLVDFPENREVASSPLSPTLSLLLDLLRLEVASSKPDKSCSRLVLSDVAPVIPEATVVASSVSVKKVVWTRIFT